MPQDRNLRVLHLSGSRVSDFYFRLSLLYARDVVRPQGTQGYYAVVHPDGSWQLGASLDALSEKLPLQAAIARLPKVDVVVPHMFCFPGMTSFRTLFEDILEIPVVGSSGHCTALAANKAHTRSIVKAAGVRVAEAQILHEGDRVTLEPPFVVKPNSEDNSLGVTLVRDRREIEAALSAGFEFDDVLLAEAYIPGRELRAAVVNRRGELYVPAAIEYLVSERHPIRSMDEKYIIRADGTLAHQTQACPIQSVCPADMTPELQAELADAVKKAHYALGCRDYSLYDFRVHAETQEPYMLEAGLFWGFGEASRISCMLAADGMDLEAVALELWSEVAGRKRVARGSLLVSA